MICPKCKSEYRQGFLTCADCDIELVPELAPEATPEVSGVEFENDYAEYIDLLTIMDPSYLAFIRSVLVAEGIEHYVLGEHASQTFGIPVQQIVRVRQDQIERAKEILDEIENNSPE